MAVHNEAEARCFRVQVELIENMQHVNRNTFGFKGLGVADFASPRGSVDIATHGSDRGDLSQFFQDFWTADVSRMQDMRRPTQSLERLGPQQSVSIGNNAENSHQ